MTAVLDSKTGPSPSGVNATELEKMAEPVEEILDDGPQPKKAAKIMTWTPPMSACLLKCLAHIAAKGVKTNKGFKEVHITKAAKDVTQLVGYEVTTTQVTNHLRKWKTRWQKIDKLRTLSGALWDDDAKMIVLADQHYLDHTQVECPGKSIDLESGETNGEGFVEAEAAFGIGGEGMDATTPSPSSGSNKKRKRVSILSDEDSIQVSNMYDALRVVAGAINNTCHAETHPDLCKTVMDLPGFEMDHKLAVLDYLTEHKGKGLNFMKMEDAVCEAAFKRIIAKNPDLI
ncbi:hypothetical protein ACQ4PT_005422 [Festuca glaucescens]